MKIISQNPRLYLDLENWTFARPRLFENEGDEDINFRYLASLIELLFMYHMLPPHERHIEVHITKDQIKYLMDNDFKEHFQTTEERGTYYTVFIPPIGKVTFIPTDSPL